MRGEDGGIVSDPRDRILHLALEEVVAGRRPPDLTDRILDTVHRVRQRRRIRITVAAAALILAMVGFGVLFLTRSDPVSPPVPPPRPVLTARDRERIDGWLELQSIPMSELDLTDPEDRARIKEIWEARRDLKALLTRRPEAWEYTRGRVLPWLGSLEDRNIRARLLEILAHGPDPGADPEILGALRREPVSFDVDLLMHLAERGVSLARSELETRVNRFPESVLAGAYFALRGDDRGEDALLQHLAQGPEAQVLPRSWWLAAAAGLRALGDDDAWKSVVQRVEREVNGALAVGDLEAARTRLLELTYFLEPGPGGAPVSIAYLPEKIPVHVRDQGAGLDTRERIRDRMAMVPR